MPSMHHAQLHMASLHTHMHQADNTVISLAVKEPHTGADRPCVHVCVCGFLVCVCGGGIIKSSSNCHLLFAIANRLSSSKSSIVSVTVTGGCEDDMLVGGEVCVAGAECCLWNYRVAPVASWRRRGMGCKAAGVQPPRKKTASSARHTMCAKKWCSFGIVGKFLHGLASRCENNDGRTDERTDEGCDSSERG